MSKGGFQQRDVIQGWSSQDYNNKQLSSFILQSSLIKESYVKVKSLLEKHYHFLFAYFSLYFLLVDIMFTAYWPWVFPLTGHRGQLRQILRSGRGVAPEAFLLVNIVNQSGLLSALKRGDTSADALISESISFLSLSCVIYLSHRGGAWLFCHPVVSGPSSAGGKYNTAYFGEVWNSDSVSRNVMSLSCERDISATPSNLAQTFTSSMNWLDFSGQRWKVKLTVTS